MADQPSVQDKPFRLEEATIDELHQAIKAGRTTWVAVVEHYIARVHAFNGVACALVTEDGACPYSKLRKPRNPGVSPTFSVLSRARSHGALRLSPDNGHIADIAGLRFSAMSVHRDFEMIKRNCSAAIRCAGPGNTSQCRLGRRALLLISIKALRPKASRVKRVQGKEPDLVSRSRRMTEPAVYLS